MTTTTQDSTSHRYRIGVDVGGTSTDAVVINLSKTSDPLTRGVVAWYKHDTTPDVTDGIQGAVRKVLEDAHLKEGDQILSLTIGTTHFINAVIEADARRLAKVAVIRISKPYSDECPPFIDFPTNLRGIMEGHYGMIRGGQQIDGSDINPLDEEALISECHKIKAKGLSNIVLIGVHSPLDVEGRHEYRARDIVRKELGPDVNIVCSRDVAQIGFLERENASILNASILTFAQRTIRGFERAMQRLGLSCPLYLTQNDGTLTTASRAAQLPIRTFASGPSNSMRGASYLAGFDLRKDGGKSTVVLDIGGTSSDVGVLLPSGFPRQASAFTEVGGVRTNFSMPDIQSIGLGGGSRIRTNGLGKHKVTVGPDSVGHYLTRDALVFGGDVLTTTDLCVLCGRAPANVDLGDASKVVGVLSQDDVETANSTIKKMLEDVVDRMKTSPEDATLLLVGGGSIIAPDRLEGVREIVRPPFFPVANAVGAAIANVSGEVDTIEILQGKVLSDILARAKAQAITKAVLAGAEESTVRIAEVNVLPLQYVTNQATRIIVRAVGELSSTGDVSTVQPSHTASGEIDVETATEGPKAEPSVLDDSHKKVDFATYRPDVVDRIWNISEIDLEFIAIGCYILGTGGGGTPYPPFLMTRQIIRDGGRIRVIDHTDLPDTAVIIRGGFMGSPSVSSERLRSGTMLEDTCKSLAKYLNVTKFDATLCDEIGGGNGMQSLLMGSSRHFDLPALDGDLMGRAYPNLFQVLPAVYNIKNALYPAALGDGDGNVTILAEVKNDLMVESILRSVCTTFGSSAALVPPPLSLAEARDYGCARTISQSWRIGRAVSICRQKNDLKGIPDAILELQSGACIFVGKIVDVTREVRAGFTWGQVKIAALLDDELDDSTSGGQSLYEKDSHLIVPFQNENICAYLEKSDGTRSVVAIVPDLISVLDSQSGDNIGSQDYAYGLRVTVIALAGDPKWTTEAGLACGGPKVYGMDDVKWSPIGTHKVPRSVIDEYNRPADAVL